MEAIYRTQRIWQNVFPTRTGKKIPINSQLDRITEQVDKVKADKLVGVKPILKALPSILDEDEEIMPRALDDVEKTTTLQILDDIEKELNSIKPITKEESNLEEEPEKEDESLENE